MASSASTSATPSWAKPSPRQTKNSNRGSTAEVPENTSSQSPAHLAREAAAASTRERQLARQNLQSTRQQSVAPDVSSQTAPLPNDQLLPSGSTLATSDDTAAPVPNNNPNLNTNPLIYLNQSAAAMANDNKKKVPESYEKNAPRFNDEEPEELPQFLDYMERMMELGETPEAEKNKFLVRYAERRPALEWKRFKSYAKSHAEFKKEIMDNYPDAKDNERGSIRKLRKILKQFDDEEIEIGDVGELMKLSRAMTVEVEKLLASNSITDREVVPLFLGKLEVAFQERILTSLDQIRDRADPPIDEDAETGYTFEEVIAEAKRLVKRNDRSLDYFQPASKKAAGETSRSMSTSRAVKKEEKSDSAALKENMEMLLAIKATVASFMDQVETSAKHTKAENEKARKEMEQFYKSLPGIVPGAANAQSFPPPREVRMRPLTQNDLCYYCADAGTHFMNNCPHRLRHINEGSLKVINGKDCYSNGVPVPSYPGLNKSKRQMVEEFQAKPKGPAQVNYLHGSYVQTAPLQGNFVQAAPGVYQQEVGESTVDINGEGVDYRDPNDYDPREDEIRTMQVENANLMRQLVQHQQQQGRGVQPPQMPVQTLDMNMVTSLLAAAMNVRAGQPPEAQLAVQTRANPSRTGPPPANEGF